MGMSAGGLGLGADAGRIALAADLGHLVADGAGLDEGAGEHLGARGLLDVVALAREQALVQKRRARHDLAVSRHLVAVRDDDEVPRHDLGDRDGTLLSPAKDADVLRREDGQLVDHALGADLLEDADHEVGEDHDDERHVLDRARREDEDRHGDVDRVEERQRMLREDPADRLGLDVGVRVGEPLRDAVGDLGVAQAGHAFPGTRRGFRRAQGSLLSVALTKSIVGDAGLSPRASPLAGRAQLKIDRSAKPSRGRDRSA